MEDDNKKPDEGSTQSDDQKLDDAQKLENLVIENNALKELLAENKKTIEELNKTMVDVKTTNAKLLNQMDVGNQSSVFDTMNELFNKYAKQK